MDRLLENMVQFTAQETYHFPGEDGVQFWIPVPAPDPIHQGGADDLHGRVKHPWGGVDQPDLLELCQRVSQWLDADGDQAEQGNL